MLDLGTAETVGEIDQSKEVELRRVAVPALQVNLQDAFTCLFAREVDEEDFVEATLTHQLGRELRNVVRRRDNEDAFFLVLKPGEEGAEDALRRSALGVLLRKRLFDLVHPEDHGRHRLGELDRALQVLLTLTDVAIVEIGWVETDQRKLPLGGHGLRAQALTATLHADQEQALGGRQAVLLGFLGILEGRLPLAKPTLELVETGHVTHVVLVREVFEHTRAFDDLTLGFEDPDDVVAFQHTVLDNGLRDDLLNLEEGEAVQRGK